MGTAGQSRQPATGWKESATDRKMSGKVIVYGGRGGLGGVVVDHFKASGHWVLSVDIGANEAADANVLVSLSAGWVELCYIRHAVSQAPEGWRVTCTTRCQAMCWYTTIKGSTTICVSSTSSREASSWWPSTSSTSFKSDRRSPGCRGSWG